MMSCSRPKLSPDEPPDPDYRRRLLVEWWIELERGGDAGATTWECLDLLRDRVTECLAYSPPLLLQAESYTAKAMLMVSGYEEC